MTIKAFRPSKHLRISAQADRDRVRLFIGRTRHLLHPADAVALADQLVDAAEQVTTTDEVTDD